ncbi:hypothetical protein OROMI_008231 [Orobanche minor]
MQRVQQRVWRRCDDGFTAATIQHTVGDAIMELFFSCIYISALFVGDFYTDGEILGTPGSLATTFLAFVLNLAFALSVMGFLIMHISLVAANTMTIEDYEKKTTPEWCYDLRRMINFQQTKGAPGNTVLAGVAPPMCSTDEAYDSISLTC